MRFGAGERLSLRARAGDGWVSLVDAAPADHGFDQCKRDPRELRGRVEDPEPYNGAGQSAQGVSTSTNSLLSHSTGEKKTFSAPSNSAGNSMC